jgi:phenylacetate-CoA ligase
MFLQVVKNFVGLMRSQWMPREQIAKMQNDRLRRIVQHAYQNVPMYRRLYDSAGVTPCSVPNVAGVTKLPIVTKEDFRQIPLEQRTASGIDLGSCHPFTSSGSTGVAVTVLEDPASVAYAQALKLRILWEYGVRPSNKICRVWYDYGPDFIGEHNSVVHLSDKLGLWGYIRRRKMKQFPLTTRINDHLAFMLRWRPEVLISTPSYCRALARLCETNGDTLTFKLVLASGEMLDKRTRRLIGERFRAEIFDHYGANDAGGTIAWECPTHSGYHVNAESLFLEFLEDGKPVDCGESGEVHVTCFHPTATPIIRYSLDDVATPLDDLCSCGRGLPLIRDIQGRKMDFILTPDGQHISPYAVIGVLGDAAGIQQYKVLQRGDFSIEVSVKTYTKHTDPVLRDVEQRCRRLFGMMPLKVKLADSLEDSLGQKLRLVESRLTG